VPLPSPARSAAIGRVAARLTTAMSNQRDIAGSPRGLVTVPRPVVRTVSSRCDMAGLRMSFRLSFTGGGSPPLDRHFAELGHDLTRPGVQVEVHPTVLGLVPNLHVDDGCLGVCLGTELS